MKKIIFLALAALSSGCYYTNTWHPQLHNTVTFDSSFTDVEKTYIMNGFNLWGSETDCDVSFVETLNGRITVKRSTAAQNIQFDKEHNADVIGLAVASAHPEVYFAMDRLKTLQDLQLVAVHEGGHMLGMEHVPQEQLAVMNPAKPDALVNNIHLTQYDLDEFNNFWRCK